MNHVTHESRTKVRQFLQPTAAANQLRWASPQRVASFPTKQKSHRPLPGSQRGLCERASTPLQENMSRFFLGDASCQGAFRRTAPCPMYST